MKTDYKTYLLLIALLCSNTLFSQDVGFSQFYNQPLLRNPALAGIFTGDVRFTASYRNQWQSVVPNPYRTFALSSDIKFPLYVADYDVTVTLGLQLLRDVAGTAQFSTTYALPAINGSIRVGENSFISGAFMGGLLQQRFDPTKLVLNDQFIAGSNGSFSIRPYSSQGFNKTNINCFDLSTGLSFNSSIGGQIDYYIGAGAFHVLNPTVGFFEGHQITLNKKIAINAGLSSAIGDADELTFYGDYFGQFENRISLKPEYTGIGTFQAGLLLSHAFVNSADENKAITAGVLYRLDDAIIPVLQLEISNLVIGASYDININKMVAASQSRGGFELTLSYSNFLNSRNSDLQNVVCPRFGRHRNTVRPLNF